MLMAETGFRKKAEPLDPLKEMLLRETHKCAIRADNAFTYHIQCQPHLDELQFSCPLRLNRHTSARFCGNATHIELNLLMEEGRGQYEVITASLKDGITRVNVRSEARGTEYAMTQVPGGKRTFETSFHGEPLTANVPALYQAFFLTVVKPRLENEYWWATHCFDEVREISFQGEFKDWVTDRVGHPELLRPGTMELAETAIRENKAEKAARPRGEATLENPFKKIRSAVLGRKRRRDRSDRDL
jgi:hypothetical protein